MDRKSAIFKLNLIRLARKFSYYETERSYGGYFVAGGFIVYNTKYTFKRLFSAKGALLYVRIYCDGKPLRKKEIYKLHERMEQCTG